MDIITTVKEFYATELKDTKRALNHPIFEPKTVINNAIQRSLGVAFFVQSLGVPFSEIELLYEVQRQELEILPLSTN